MSKRNFISCHVFWIMSCVTVSMADVILSCRCWIFLIFSAYTMFLMYPHRKKSSGEWSGLRGGLGIGPPLPIQARGNLSFKMSVTKQLKWRGALSCPTYSFLFECFNLWKHVLFKEIEIDNPVRLFRWSCIFMPSLWIIRGLRKFSDESCGKCHNIQFTSNPFFLIFAVNCSV